MKSTGWLSALAERLTSLRSRRRSAIRRRTARGTRLENHSASWITERLEDRALLATVSESINSTLTISLSAGEDLVVVSNGSSYSFSSDLNFSPSGISNLGDFSPFGTTSLTLLASGRAYFNTVSIVDAGAAATVRFNSSLGHSYSDNVSVVLNDPNAGTITFSGNETFIGSNSLSATTTKNIVINSGASITTADGDLTLSANQQLVPRSGTFVGIDVGNNGLVRSQGNGDVTVLRRGGTIGNANIGVLVHTGADVIGGTTGLLTVQGTGGGGGGPSSLSNNGVEVDGVGSSITSSGSSVFVTGTGGGTGSGFNNLGVVVSNSGVITAGGAGQITIVGQGGTGTGGGNRGVLVSGGNARITSNQGPVSVTGTEGASSVAIDVVNTGVITTVSNNGPITLVGNSMNFDNSATISASSFSSVTLRPRTNGVETYLGGFGDSSGGPLLLSNAELNRVNAGRIVVGSNLAGSVFFGSPIALAGTDTLEVISGGMINDTGSSTAFTDSRLVLQAASGIGTSGPLNVAVSRLEASGGNGGLNVANSGTLIIGGIGPQNGVSVSGGNLSVSATILQVSEPVANSGAGSVSLSSSGVFGGPELDIAASVSANGGNITLNATDDIQVLSSVTTSGSGGVDFNANQDSNTDGGIYLFNTISAGSGGISLSGWNSVHAADLMTSGGDIIFDLSLQTRLDSDVVFNTTNGSAAGANVTVDVPIIGSGSPRNLTINGGTGGAINLPESIGFANNLINNVSLTGGSVTVGSEVTAQGTIDVTATNSIAVNAGAGLTTTGGSQTLTADAISLNTSVTPATISAGTGRVTLRPFANGTAINLGGADAPGSLGLTDAELDRITAGTIHIGDAASGAITVIASFNANNSATQHWQTGSSVSQASGTSITESALAIEAVGNVDLYGNNVIGTIAARSTSGNLSFRNISGDTAVGTVDGVHGFVALAGGITFSVSSGHLTIRETPLANDVQATGLTAFVANDKAFIVETGAVVATTGQQSYLADKMVLNGSLSAPGQLVSIQLYQATTKVDLGSTTDVAVNTLELSDAELDRIGARILRIGGSNRGAITISSDIDLSDSPVIDILDLETGSTVTGTAGGVKVANLAISANGNVLINDATTDVTTLAISNAASGAAITFVDQGSLTVGSVVSAGVTGVTASNGPVSISTDGSLTVNSPISIGTGAIHVASYGNDSLLTINSAITAGDSSQFIADKMAIHTGVGSINVGLAGVMLTPESSADSGDAINLGSATNAAANTLELSDAELDRVTAGVLQFGDALNGIITVSAAITRSAPTNLFLSSGNGTDIAINPGSLNSAGGGITFNVGFGGQITSNASGTDVTGYVFVNGELAPGASAGLFIVAGDVNFSAADTFSVEVNGSATAGVDYDQLSVSGTVNLGNATLNATGSIVAAPIPIVLIDNDGTGPINGRFNGLDDGGTIHINGIPFEISYFGGDGNDVVLIGNQPPNIAVDIASVSTPEGTPATNSGTFSDPQGNSTVTLTASVGTITPNNANGTWSWSIAALEGPADPVSVTITATDDFGETATTSFTYSVTNVAPLNVALSLSASAIDENGSTLLSGSFVDPGTLDPHTVTIDWGDGTPNTVLTLAAGVTSFSNVVHQYLDDGALPGNGTSSDNYSIQVEVADDDGGHTSGSVSLTVNNVAPSGVVLNSGTIDENGAFKLIGQFVDPSLQDAHTVLIDWGDGNTETVQLGNIVLGSGDPAARQFAASHRYLDDGPSPGNGTPSDQYPINVTVIDDDMGLTTGSTIVTVNNVAPSNLSLSVRTPTIDEMGIARLSGSFVDPGTLDTHTVTVNWGDGSPDTILNLGAGETRFRDISHQYLDDNPAGTGSDNYTISVTVSDDDSGRVSNVASIRVNNVAPEIVSLSLSSTDIDEGQSVSVQGVFRDPALGIPTERFRGTASWSDGVSTPLTIDERTGEFSTSRAFPDDAPSGTPSDPLSVTVTIEDDDLGRDAEQSAPITIHNVAPELFDLSATSANENGFVTLTGRYTDVGVLDTHTLTIDWGEGLSEVVSVSGGSFSVTHQYLDDNPTATASDAHSINVTLTDDDTGSDTERATTTITNVAPVLVSLGNSSPECGDAAEGDTVTVSSSFNDIGTLDTHSATIAWGDGSITSAIINQGVGGGTLSGSHAYAAGGIYTITVTLADDDGGTITSTTTTVVTGVGIVGNTLYVIGTDGNDHVTVNQAGSVYRVHANFLGSASFRDVPIAGVSRIVVQVCDGNDHVSISGGITLPALIDGGAGNDQLNGGNGSNIILGGEGNDMVVGGNSRDLLIGGGGADRIVGNSSDDLLISGTTTFDADDAALNAIMSEWNSERTFANRVANIRGAGTGPRQNGSNFLRLGMEVFDDGAVDKLTGSAGSDFFLYNVGQDLLTDFKSGEAIN